MKFRRRLFTREATKEMECEKGAASVSRAFELCVRGPRELMAPVCGPFLSTEGKLLHSLSFF